MTTHRCCDGIRRRDLVRVGALGAAGLALGDYFRLAAAGEVNSARATAAIFVNLAGGPSHIDTFDPKPDAPANIRGEFTTIDTSAPRIQICEHFPKFAKLMKHAAILRGMCTQESDHKLATYNLHTGYQNRAGAVAFPSLGAIVAKELGKRDVPLPNFVCIGKASPEAVGAGFLGPDHQPLAVTDPERALNFIDPAGSRAEFGRQVSLLGQLDKAFHDRYRSAAGVAHRSAIDRAVRLMDSEQKRAFDLSREKDAVREAYGRPGRAAAPAPGRRPSP